MKGPWIILVNDDEEINFHIARTKKECKKWLVCMGGRDDHTMIAWWSGPKVVALPPDVEAGLKALGL